MSGSIEKWLFVPDTHRPFHDKLAWATLLAAGLVLKPDGICCLGDLADCWSVSFHSKSPNRKEDFEEEMDDVELGLIELGSLGAKKKHYVFGNHEHRLDRYLMDKAPALFNSIKLEKRLGLKQKGWGFTAYTDYFEIGKLHITHDDDNAGRTAHMKALDSFQDNVVIGHTHRTALIIERNLKGRMHVAAMFGWLGDFSKVDYMHRAKMKAWTHGFGIGYHDTKTGIVWLVPVPIINGTAMVEGKLVTGKVRH